jgi:hypothetical protein
MALLAPPDVGVRGPALLKNGLKDNEPTSEFALLNSSVASTELILFNLVHPPVEEMLYVLHV